MSKELFSLTELAKNLNVNRSKLVYYAKLGLLKPEEVMGQSRVFRRNEVNNRLKQINNLRKKGYSLTKIKQHFQIKPYLI